MTTRSTLPTPAGRTESRAPAKLSESPSNITSPAADQLHIDIPSGLNERLDAVRAKPHEHRGTTGLHPA